VNVEQERLESFLKTAEVLQIKGLTDGLKDPGGGVGGSCSTKFRHLSQSDLTGRTAVAKAFEEGAFKRGRKSVEAAHQPPLLHSSPEKRLKLVPPGTAVTPKATAALSHHMSSTASELSDHENMVIDDEYEDEDEGQEAGSDGGGGGGVPRLPRPPPLEDVNENYENYDDGEYVDDGEVPDDDDEEYILLAGDAVTSDSGGVGGGTLTAAPGGEKEDLGPLHKRCPVCHMIMLKKNLSRHIRDQHTTERPRSTCPVCKKTYKTADWLKDHIRRGHGYTKEATDEVMAKVKAEQQQECSGNSNSSTDLQASSPVAQA
jgi:uncharacterized C2H2 Zn-finger protein